MKNFVSKKNLEKFSHVLFLYFSWLELKYIESFLFFLSYSKVSLSFFPLSKKWFYRTSFLLKNRKYNYFEVNGIRNFYNVNTLNLLFYNNKIIENSIFNCIFPFFRNNYFFKNLSLVEYVIFVFKI